jgi:heme oxygenase (biliverdin-IX-beta and delta-forming)
MILAKLKEATREQHENLENTVTVMDQMFSLENYKELLCKFYRFYSSIEPEIDKLDLKAAGYDFDKRRKLPKLEKDLKNLEVLEAAKGLPRWEGVPPLRNNAQAFGSLYVMEGATLGGQIINRHLKEHLGISPENGGAFFNGYGAETGPMWKEFMGIANAFAENAGQDDVIIDSAKQTFDSFRDCFVDTQILTKLN